MGNWGLEVKKWMGLGLTVHAFSPSTQEAKQVDLWIPGYRGIHREFQNSQGYVERLCLERERERESDRQTDRQTETAYTHHRAKIEEIETHKCWWRLRTTCMADEKGNAQLCWEQYDDAWKCWINRINMWPSGSPSDPPKKNLKQGPNRYLYTMLHQQARHSQWCKQPKGVLENR